MVFILQITTYFFCITYQLLYTVQDIRVLSRKFQEHLGRTYSFTGRYIQYAERFALAAMNEVINCFLNFRSSILLLIIHVSIIPRKENIPDSAFRKFVFKSTLQTEIILFVFEM